MNATERALNELRVEDSALRSITVAHHQALELERSRITAIENAVHAQAHRNPELEQAITTNRRSLAQLSRTDKARSENLRRNLDQHARDQLAVLGAHTASIFRLEERIDRLCEGLDARIDRTARALLVENHANSNHRDTVPLVDAPHGLTDVLATDAKGGIAPEPTQVP